MNICDKEEATRFINSIATRNDTDMRPSTVEFKRKGFTSLRYNCSRKVKTSTESQETVPDKKRKVENRWGRGLDVLHIFHTKCLIARTRRVWSVLTYR